MTASSSKPSKYFTQILFFLFFFVIIAKQVIQEIFDNDARLSGDLRFSLGDVSLAQLIHFFANGLFLGGRKTPLRCTADLDKWYQTKKASQGLGLKIRGPLGEPSFDWDVPFSFKLIQHHWS